MKWGSFCCEQCHYACIIKASAEQNNTFSTSSNAQSLYEDCPDNVVRSTLKR